MTCLLLSEQSTSDVLRGNCLFQVDRGPTGRYVLASSAAALPPHSADFPLQLLDFAHTWCQRGDNGIDIFDVLPLAAAVCPISYGILIAAIGPHQPPTPQRHNVADSVDNSASHTRGVPHIGDPKIASLQLLRLQPGSRSSDVVCLSGKDDSSYCRSTRTSWWRHPQYWTLRREFHDQSSRSVCLVHLRRLRGLLEFYSWTPLLHPRKFAAPHPLAILIVLFPRCQFLKVCLALSLRHFVSDSPACV